AAAVAGSAATTHEGENGFAKFDVTVSLGEESYTLDNQSVNIIATYFDGVLDAEAIAEAETKLEAITWADIAQEDGNTEDAVRAILEGIVADTLKNYKLTIKVEITDFAAAVAGSAATTHEGENGFAKFDVTVSLGEESYTLSAQEVAIIATYFDGVLDAEAIAAALEQVVGGEVVVKIRATEEEIEAAVADYVRALLTGEAEGVEVSVSFEGGQSFKVTLEKGNESAEKVIEMTITEEDPIKLPAPTGLSFRRGIAAWSRVEIASGYVVNLYSIKGDTVTLLMTVEVDTNKYDFTADIKDNVSYFFDVTAKGDGVFFLDSDASEDSDVYKNQRNDIVDQILADMLAMRNRRFNIIAIAGVGGSISDEGVSRVKFGTSKTYTITANEGYEIVSVIVDGRDVGAVSEYKFKDVRAKHTIEVIFAESAWENPFVDIYETDTYYEAIEFVYENGLFKGTSETEFEPATTMTRAMFVTVLWRLHGEPVVNYLMQFDDVEADTWYTEAVRWASAEFIVNGYGDGKFGVDDEITVEQATVIIARYAAYTDNYKAADVNLKNYTDGEFVSYWAKDQMMWALENGIYESVGGKLDPQAAAPRSLVAEMFYRYVVKFEK
ncbi:MAG: S-layer homology domain-containing protein, partial [Selenomonadales bacterium]|nr:S-layer homology domain-containing protein [Selenomonadales bacterium]